MTRPSATATTVPAAVRANSAVRSSTLTGGSVAIASRSSATAAKSSAVARASSTDAGLTTNWAIARTLQHPDLYQMRW